MPTEPPIRPGTVYPIQFAAAIRASEENSSRICADAPWLGNLPQLCETILHHNASVRSRLRKLRDLADHIAAAIAPHSACKPNCSHCCHIAVSLSHPEAVAIGDAIGMPITFQGTPINELDHPDKVRDMVNGKPCVFLKDSKCSIYAERPIACRLHFSLANSPFFCSPDIPARDSAVPNLDMSPFWIVYCLITAQHGSGDLREFFPDNKAAQITIMQK